MMTNIGQCMSPGAAIVDPGWNVTRRHDMDSLHGAQGITSLAQSRLWMLKKGIFRTACLALNRQVRGMSVPAHCVHGEGAKSGALHECVDDALVVRHR
jgi:hypothetical protein